MTVLFPAGLTSNGVSTKTPPQAASFLIRRNLDQAAVGIPAVDRPQRPAGALFHHRSFFDHNAARLEMHHHLLRRTRREEAQIIAARRLVVGGEPLDLVGT